ncbi:MAG: hypothetical protein IKV90_04020 [Clostridia bacterium]|nr:hypothetical protein [Clostridia bacterium]
MIDYVHLSHLVNIPERAFNPIMWKEKTYPDEGRYFVRSIRGVHLRYYPSKTLFTIEGKLLMLLRDTQVHNVDDVYGADTDQFIKDINDHLNRLFPHPYFDIRDFYVYRIDYCFNINTRYVKTYLDFLNTAFARCENGNRINHVKEQNLDGSIYVRTASDYKHKTLKNYTLNFYDKEDCLRKKQADGERVLDADFAHAKDILRLEVQCGYVFIDQLCKRAGIPNCFGCLFDYNIAFLAEELIYSRVFGCEIEQDFYSYYEAKKLLPAKSNAAKKALYDASTLHSIRGDKYARGRKVIKEAGIYPFCFLPKECGVDRLDNPLKLIAHKVDGIFTELEYDRSR